MFDDVSNNKHSNLNESVDEVWLTVQQAARLLHVSKTYLIGLVNQSQIQSSQTEEGHYRLLKTEVLRFKITLRKSQEAGFEKMIRVTEKLDLYD